jgi:hypothetical protein
VIFLLFAHAEAPSAEFSCGLRKTEPGNVGYCTEIPLTCIPLFAFFFSGYGAEGHFLKVQKMQKKAFLWNSPKNPLTAYFLLHKNTPYADLIMLLLPFFSSLLLDGNSLQG